MFELIGYIETFKAGGNTSHALNRSKRLQVAERLIYEERAKVLKIAVVNKGHENGNEIHIIYYISFFNLLKFNMIISIFNVRFYFISHGLCNLNVVSFDLRHSRN